jgi:hypothetical protein
LSGKTSDPRGTDIILTSVMMLDRTAWGWATLSCGGERGISHRDGHTLGKK